MPRVSVHLLPTLVATDELAGSACAVIDVLRATTTIVSALAAGATAVIPCLEITDARRIAKQNSADQVVLGGERQGVAITGFDCGNSPSEYGRDRVADKLLAFTTTNGTRALLHSAQATEIYVAAFLNAIVTADRLAAASNESIHILCAGTDGQITREDTLLAGYLVELLLALGSFSINDSARIALAAWRELFTEPPAVNSEAATRKLALAFRDSLGGSNLCELGLEQDLLSAAQLNSMPLVARFYPESSRILTVL